MIKFKLNEKNDFEYIYDGPVYQFNRYICDVGPIYTKADSEKAAKRNFLYNIKKELNLDPSANLQIEETLIDLVNVSDNVLEPKIGGNDNE